MKKFTRFLSIFLCCLLMLPYAATAETIGTATATNQFWYGTSEADSPDDVDWALCSTPNTSALDGQYSTVDSSSRSIQYGDSFCIMGIDSNGAGCTVRSIVLTCAGGKTFGEVGVQLHRNDQEGWIEAAATVTRAVTANGAVLTIVLNETYTGIHNIRVYATESQDNILTVKEAVLYDSVETAPAVSKKGITASRYGNGTEASLNKLEDLGASWYYNWGVNAPSTATSLEFVPMMWNGMTVTQHLEAVQEGCEAGVYKNVLGFNEPDNSNADGSSMSVEDALDYWGELQELSARLGSPCPMYPGNYTSGWLKEFMDGCEERGYRVDFIAVHCYQEVATKSAQELAADLEALVTSVYETYGLPIWVTEFGTIDNTYSASYTEAKSVEVMQACTQVLEECGFVERYSFFVDNFGGDAPASGAYTRLYYDNDEMSQLGQAYTAVETQSSLEISTDSLPAALVGEAYAASVQTVGGTAPYTYSAEGLPYGLQLNAATGAISGTPKHPQESVKIIVTDARGQSTWRRYSIMDADFAGVTAVNKQNWNASYAEFFGTSPWFVDHDASSIVDGSYSTGYTVTRTQTVNDAFWVQFASDVAVGKVVISSLQPDQTPSFCKMQAWNAQAQSWEDVSYTLTQKEGLTIVSFPTAVTTSRLILQLTADDSTKNWSIAEWDVYAY